jgi:Family of unknown function (DUF6338)
MNINATFIQFSLIFLPGIIWAALDARFAAKKEVSQFNLMINAFLFGVASYAITFLIYTLLHKPFALGSNIRFDEGVSGLSNVVDEIVTAIVVAFAGAILWLYGSTYKVFTRFFQFIRATKRYGDEDVWDYLLNSDSPITEYVNVRDFDKKIAYSGYVSIYSESGALRELVLRDAEVYDFAGNLMFRMPHIYVARKPDDMHIEFPYDPGAVRS